MRQVGGQSLIIEKRPIGAAQILDEVLAVLLADLAVTTRDPPLKPPIRSQIDIREDTMSGVQPSYMDVLLRWELNLTTRRENSDPQHGVQWLIPLLLGVTIPGMRLGSRQVLLRNRFGSEWATGK
jgi:hypothetical protein